MAWYVDLKMYAIEEIDSQESEKNRKTETYIMCMAWKRESDSFSDFN